ncbi:unnamed protein product [Amoebophrya sp. A25]|nr:unnamed protein product [Amoebophrya sp. A25]|eukprot:GSA25T00011707001.1
MASVVAAVYPWLAWAGNMVCSGLATVVSEGAVEHAFEVCVTLLRIVFNQLCSHSAWYNLLAFLPLYFVFDAVRNQRKGVAAVAQIGSLQQRNDVAVRAASSTDKATTPISSPALRSESGQPTILTSEDDTKEPCLKAVGERKASSESLVGDEPALLSEASAIDKLWFVLGVGNVALTPYILGLAPTWYYVYYTPKVVLLTLLRWVKFVKKRQHYLLYDFCYWCNGLSLLYCWVFPQSSVMFRVVFINATGPLALAVLCFNHSLIFHSYAHMTSVIIHVSPLCLVYGLRWYSDPYFAVCDDHVATRHERFGPACEEITHLQLVWDAMRYFYLPWSVIYFLWIFVALGKYIEERNYQTLWDRVLGMGRIGRFLKWMLTKFPKIFVQAFYLLIHLLYSVISMAFASMLFHFQLAHFLFLVAICAATAYNGAQFYLQALEPLYRKALVERRQGQGIRSSNLKILLSASMGLQNAVEKEKGE